MRAIAMLAGALWACACVGGCNRSHVSAASKRPGELVVVRGDLEDIVLLTGKLDALSSEVLVTPSTRSWNVSIRWMEENGKKVSAGQRVLEFDNSELASQLEEKRLAALQAENDLTRQVAEDAILTADKSFAVTQHELALAKAELDAAITPDLMAERDYQEKQLARKRTQVALERARDDHMAQNKSAELTARIKRIELDTARREINAQEAEIEALVLKAPRDGIIIVQEHPWERREFQVGDMLWPGMAVLKIPDLSVMQVKAWLFDVDDGRIAVGMRATCVVDAYPAGELGCVIKEISPVANEPARGSLLRAYSVLVALDRTDPDTMRPGMSVKVMVHGRKVKDALLAPRQGLDLSIQPSGQPSGQSSGQPSGQPARARLAQGGEVAVDIDFCTAQACVITQGLGEGTRLRPAGGVLP